MPDDLGNSGDDSPAGGDLGDELYRKVAMQFERESSRVPTLGNPDQAGWDIKSEDQRTKEVRLIEVKGRGRKWDHDEVVEVSRAQVRKAFQSMDTLEEYSWYLYVVEKNADGTFRVLPIPNPVGLAAKWMMSGGAWRMVAEGPRTIALRPA